MTTTQKSFIHIFKQPFAIAGMLIVAALLVVLVSQASRTVTTTSVSEPELPANHPSVSTSDAGSNTPMGQEVPQIMRNLASAPTGAEGSVNAPGLDRLVKGLEDKVAADPSNVNNRILLAQTYNELGMQEKALTVIRALNKDQPDNAHLNLIMCSILTRSNDQEKLQESLKILDKLSKDKTVQQYLVNLYRGDALIGIKDHPGALKYWKLALKDMPPADNRRVMLEQRIANLSATSSGNKEPVISNGK